MTSQQNWNREPGEPEDVSHRSRKPSGVCQNPNSKNIRSKDSRGSVAATGGG